MTRTTLTSWAILIPALVGLGLALVALYFQTATVVQPTAAVETRTEEIGPLVGPADREFWRKTDAMAPERERPKWVETGAGSVGWSADAFGIQARGRIPGPEGLLAGYSPDLYENESEALKEASRSAARHFVAIAAATGSGLLYESSDRQSGGPKAIPKSVVVEAARAFEAEALDFVARKTQDRFVEEIAKPYGVLFRAAVLVSAKPEDVRGLGARFRDLVLEKQEARTDARRQVLLAAAAALGMAVVVFLLYSFVNAGTKGYFAWPLRVLSIGTLLILYLGLMYALDWFPR